MTPLTAVSERFDAIAIEAEHVIGAHEVNPVDAMPRVSHAAAQAFQEPQTQGSS